MIKRRRFFWLIALAVIILFIGAFGTYAMFKANQESNVLLTSQTSKVTLEIFSGTVFITDPTTGKEAAATNAQPVIAGSLIRTDGTGRAQVVYSNGTVTRIDYNSSITITKTDTDPQQISVSITIGRVWSRVKKLLGKESYQTQTGTVVATVRGTSFGHGILADGRNKITTSKRTVDVHCLNDTQSGQVSQNMKFLLDCQAGSKSEIIPIDDSDQDEWYQFNLEQDRLLDARFGAQTYDDQGEIQGASASATPTVSAAPTKKPQTPTKSSPTVAPTPTQSPSTPNPTTTSTPAPAATPTPTPAPKPTPTPTNQPFLLRPINPQLFQLLAPPTPSPQIN